MADDINGSYGEYVKGPSRTSLEKIIIDGEGIVRHFAAVYGSGFDHDDLYQTGMTGLLRAVHTFDAQSGAQFSTWAATCVISEIRHYVRREQAYRTECPEEAVSDLQRNSLPQAQTEPGDGSAFCLEIEDRIALKQAMSTLGLSHREVIDALFCRGLTQQQTADELGLSQRKVSRMKVAAIKIMQALLDPNNFHLVEPEKSFKKI